MIKKIHTFLHEGEKWRGAASFEPGEKLKEQLRRLGEARSYTFSERDDGNLELSKLAKEPSSGVYLRVGKALLYLSLSSSPDALRAASELHALLLSLDLYHISKKELLGYFEKPDDCLNRAEDYASESLLARSRYLCELLKAHAPSLTSALEIGCNIGRNLAFLKEALNIEVAGIEWSAYALEQLPKFYPSLRGAQLFQGDCAELLPTLKEKSYDCLFTMAVLMHLHPDTPASFYREMVRVARRFIVTIEYEGRGSDRHFARNYRMLLEPWGARQVHEEPPPAQCPGLAGYVARVFQVLR